MGEALTPKQRRLMANFNCKPVLHHIRHGSRMSISPCGMWALQSVLDDMLRRILSLSINDTSVTTRRYIFGQDPPLPYPVLVLHRPGCEDPPASALWKLRKPAAKFYGLVLKHSAPIVQSIDSFGFVSHAGKVWIPPPLADNADADDDLFSDQELVDEDFGSVSEVHHSIASGVAVEAIRLVPVPDISDSCGDDENAFGWFWQNDSGDLMRYQMIEQAQLEAAFQSYQADNSLFQFPLTIASHPDRRYIVDFQEMIQINLDTHNTRVILNEVREDVSLQEMFLSLKEADRISGRTVRLLSKYDKSYEICTASWHESSTTRTTLAVLHESSSVSFFVHSVAFKESTLSWDFQVCLASSSKPENVHSIGTDEGSLSILLRDARLDFGQNLFPYLACVQYPLLALSDMSSSSEGVGDSAVSASGGPLAQDIIEDMSDEEQLMLAMALSSSSQNFESADSDASNAGASCSFVSSSVVPSDRCGRLLAAEDAPLSLPQVDAATALPVSENRINKDSGICFSLKFSIPFDVCTSLPSASAKVNIRVGDQTAPLGTLRFQEAVCDEEDHQPSDLEQCATSTILETFRMLDDNGNFIDEQVDLSSIPASGVRHSLLDHVMIENAVKKILSQELLVRWPPFSLKHLIVCTDTQLRCIVQLK
jgi:hypothetical protein